MGGFEDAGAAVAVFDVGGVLLRIDDDGHLRHLAGLTGLPVDRVREAVHGTGLYDRFDGGGMVVGELVEELRRGLDAPGLGEDEVRFAWGMMLRDPDPVLCALAARLAAEGRLLLATNCSPLHWLRVNELLVQAGVPEVPSVISSEVLVGKPNPRYFDFVHEALAARACLTFVDDREANVKSAEAARLPVWLHRNAVETARHVTALAWQEARQ